MIASSVGRKHRYFQLLCTLTICRRYTGPVDFASSVNLPAPEKDSTLAAATFLQPTSAM